MTIDKQQIVKNFPVLMTGIIWATSFFKTLNSFVIGIFGVYCLYVGWPYIRKISKHDIVLFLPIALYLVYLVGLFWADDLSYGWSQLEKRTSLASFPLMYFLLRHKLTQSDITRMLYVFLGIFLIISVICYVNALWNIIQHGSLKVAGRPERTYYYLSYVHLTRPVGIDPIYLSLYINFSIIILLFRPLKNRIITYALLFYLTIFNVLVASKAGIIGLTIIFLIYLVGLIKNRFLAIGVCLAVISVILLTVRSSKFLADRFIVSTKFDYELPYAGDWNSTSQRLAIWSCAIEAIEEVFPLGYGTGNGQNALNKMYTEKKYIRGYEDKYNAHNEFLYSLMDTGIFGFLTLVFIIVWPLYQSIKRKDSLFMYFLILVFFYFFVEVVFARRLGIHFFSFFYGLLALNGLIVGRTVQTNIPQST